MFAGMSDPNFYVHPGLDRAAHRRRDEDWLAEARRAAAIVPVWQGRNLAVVEPPAAVFLELDVLLSVGVAPDDTIFLGLDDDRPLFAADLSGLGDDHAQALAAMGMPGAEFVDLRRIGQHLPRGDGALLAYARGLAHWHGRTRFCGACGGPTQVECAGHVRRCTGCGLQHFPRTDPATIMLVTDGERCLVGRQAAWAPGMYSTLAGFVEPGECLEDAVVREVFEETGVRCGRVTYHASQPWPFPQSLMCGFFAEALTTEIIIDPEEIEDARWVSRADLRAGVVALPRADSIARRLIETWLQADRSDMRR